MAQGAEGIRGKYYIEKTCENEAKASFSHVFTFRYICGIVLRRQKGGRMRITVFSFAVLILAAAVTMLAIYVSKRRHRSPFVRYRAVTRTWFGILLVAVSCVLFGLATEG
jgi:hypothetical protein